MDMRRVIVAGMCLLFLTTPALHAADEWWRLGLDGKAKASEPSSSKKTSGGWWPWSSSAPKKRSSQPTTYQKLTRGTKNAWGKTVDFINPFDNKPAKPAEKPKSGSEPNAGGWFTSQATQEKPLTIPDWIAGERPAF